MMDIPHHAILLGAFLRIGTIIYISVCIYIDFLISITVCQCLYQLILSRQSIPIYEVHSNYRIIHVSMSENPILANIGQSMNYGRFSDVGWHQLEYQLYKILSVGWGYQLYESLLYHGCCCFHSWFSLPVIHHLDFLSHTSHAWCCPLFPHATMLHGGYLSANRIMAHKDNCKLVQLLEAARSHTIDHKPL